MKIRTTGFTVLEILIAATVLIILITLIFTLVRHSSAAGASLSARNTFQSVCARLTDQLRQDLGSASDVTIDSHRIYLQRYTTWTSGTGLSTEPISYSADGNGIIVDRSGKTSRHDLDFVLKTVDGTLEFNTSVKAMPTSSPPDMSVIEIAIRIVPSHRDPLPGFAHVMSINTTARVKAVSVPEANGHPK